MQESINRAIDRLRDKIKNATREIDRAQAHVMNCMARLIP